jgi:hypothetical protein
MLFDGHDHMVGFVLASSFTKVYSQGFLEIHAYDNQTIDYHFVSHSEASMDITHYVVNAVQSLASEEDHSSLRE